MHSCAKKGSTCTRTCMGFKKSVIIFMASILCLALPLGCVTSTGSQGQSASPSTSSKSGSPSLQNQLLEKQLKEINQKLEEVYHRISVIQFMIDEHEIRLLKMEKTLKDSGSGLTAAPSETMTSESTQSNTSDTQKTKQSGSSQINSSDPVLMIYNNGLSAYKAEEYDSAFDLFSTLVEKYSDHELADNALYWSGECYYSQKKYTEAIEVFTNLVAKYPKGGKVPDALLKTAYAYLALDDKENAKTYLREVIVNYPFSPAGVKAEEKLNML